MLSSSAAARDVTGAYDRNANAHLVKSLDLDEFTTAGDTLRRFWLELARLPSHAHRSH